MRRNLVLGFLWLLSSAGVVSAQVREEWVARYSGPGSDGASALALDADGNVYVTGGSSGVGTWGDYATVKYDPTGNQLWVARYNGPGNDEDYATVIAVDADGHVYVTGQSRGVGTLSDYATVKYDADGNQLWAARYNGPGNDWDTATALAVDADGNVYVTGWSCATGGNPCNNMDYATIKYDADGNQLWVARYNGPANLHDQASALALDANGNVYVTGASCGTGPYPECLDYATVKYDSDGNPLWVARYNGPGNSSDRAYALALDADGNVRVTGGSWGVGTHHDYATVNYDPDGNPLWVGRYDGPANRDDVAIAIALDAAGNAHVTGHSCVRPLGGLCLDYDYATVKYDADGNQLWVARYDGTGMTGARALAVDADGNVYVTGRSQGVGTRFDYTTIKYGPAGNQLWLARYNGPANHDDSSTAIALDADGHVYVTGAICVRPNPYYPRFCADSDYATIKYVPQPPAGSATQK